MQNVHVLTYSHKHGDDVSVHATAAAADEALAGIVREYWHEAAVENDDLPEQAPDDDAEAIRLYFDALEAESYDITYTAVQGGEQRPLTGIAFGDGAHDAQIRMLNTAQGYLIALLGDDERVPDGDHFTSDDLVLIEADDDGIRGYAVGSDSAPVEPKQVVQRGWDTFTSVYVY